MNSPSVRAISSPTLDPWITGGLSILVLTAFLLLSASIPSELVIGNFLILTVLLNGSHFMASYFLLYSSWDFIKRYRWASIYLPTLLTTVGIVGLYMAAGSPSNDFIIRGLLIIASLYLALHYTGQAWGMMASFAFLHSIKFTDRERFGFRLCLRIMAAWHMGWAVLYLPGDYKTALVHKISEPAIHILHLAALVSFIAGVILVIGLTRRLKRLPPASLLLPFASIYLWYAFLWVYPQSIFWVQLFHSLQYLAFPARVELNRSQQRASSNAAQWAHVLKYSIVLVLTSTIVFVCVERSLNFPGSGLSAYWLVIAAIINIHHYFIDGCIWHIKTPEVRRDLFAHLA